MSPSPGVTLDGHASIGGAPLFGPIQLTLGAGRWTCLLGGSGVGKSTVLRLIAGLPTEAAFDGRIQATDGEAVAPRAAYMAQDDLLLPWATVSQNIALGARLRGEAPDRARVRHILGRIGLTEHADKTPAALSGGQRQRAALARTLMEDKPLILLDEPFSALDAKTRTETQDLAVEVLQGKTVLVVTHDPAEAARLGHKILVMAPDGLTECAPPTATIPRPVDALETLESQAALLRLLRVGAA